MLDSDVDGPAMSKSQVKRILAQKGEPSKSAIDLLCENDELEHSLEDANAHCRSLFELLDAKDLVVEGLEKALETAKIALYAKMEDNFELGKRCSRLVREKCAIERNLSERKGSCDKCISYDASSDDPFLCERGVNIIPDGAVITGNVVFTCPADFWCKWFERGSQRDWEEEKNA